MSPKVKRKDIFYESINRTCKSLAWPWVNQEKKINEGKLARYSQSAHVIILRHWWLIDASLSSLLFFFSLILRTLSYCFLLFTCLRMHVQLFCAPLFYNFLSFFLNIWKNVCTVSKTARADLTLFKKE